MSAAKAFDYPLEPHSRRHGPQGYTDYTSFREWLRDEFCFRCVFCLRREQWLTPLCDFHIDHCVPQSLAPDRVCDYDNLLYVCSKCNDHKGNKLAPDPCKVAFGRSLRVCADGSVEWLDTEGAMLVKVLRLDSEERTRHRSLTLDIIKLAAATDRKLFVRLMGFPDDLRDLRKMSPTSNSRPEGIAESFYARRERGELPETY